MPVPFCSTRAEKTGRMDLQIRTDAVWVAPSLCLDLFVGGVASDFPNPIGTAQQEDIRTA